MQRVRWVTNLRARSCTLQVQGVRWGCNLRARPSALCMQRVPRVVCTYWQVGRRHLNKWTSPSDDVPLPLRNERLPLLVHVSTRPSSGRLIPAAARPALRLTPARLGTTTRAPTRLQLGQTQHRVHHVPTRRPLYTKHAVSLLVIARVKIKRKKETDLETPRRARSAHHVRPVAVSTHDAVHPAEVDAHAPHRHRATQIDRRAPN